MHFWRWTWIEHFKKGDCWSNREPWAVTCQLTHSSIVGLSEIYRTHRLQSNHLCSLFPTLFLFTLATQQPLPRIPLIYTHTPLPAYWASGAGPYVTVCSGDPFGEARGLQQHSDILWSQNGSRLLQVLLCKEQWWTKSSPQQPSGYICYCDLFCGCPCGWSMGELLNVSVHSVCKSLFKPSLWIVNPSLVCLCSLCIYIQNHYLDRAHVFKMFVIPCQYILTVSLSIYQERYTVVTIPITTFLFTLIIHHLRMNLIVGLTAICLPTCSLCTHGMYILLVHQKSMSYSISGCTCCGVMSQAMLVPHWLLMVTSPWMLVPDWLRV